MSQNTSSKSKALILLKTPLIDRILTPPDTSEANQRRGNRFEEEVEAAALWSRAGSDGTNWTCWSFSRGNIMLLHFLSEKNISVRQQPGRGAN
jgi:hypothetical protein